MKKQKQISLLNLKKCLRVSLFLFLGGLTQSSLGYSIEDHQTLQMRKTLQADLKSRKGNSFETLVQSWEKRFGTQAFRPLIQIASDRKVEDTHRYVAFMSATKLGGAQSVPVILFFLKDSSWMIRSGALRVLATLGTSEHGPNIIPLLHDPALVVRSEAVETIKALRPQGAVDALFSLLKDEKNYHQGRAQWVPQKVLEALLALQAKEVAPHMVSLLEHPIHRNDPEFRKQMAQTAKLLNQ